MPIMAKHMDRRKMQRDLYAAYKAGSLNAPENPMNGIESIASERARQIEIEGWTPEHDDAHEDGAMALAASLYAFQAHTDAAHCHGVALARRDMCPTQWPWAADWWKPKDRRRDLVRAGALIAAEIDRLDCAAVRDVNQSN